MEDKIDMDFEKTSPIADLCRSAKRGDFCDFEKILYHYTSPEGLLGITSEQEINLYFSQYSALNDISEGKVLKNRFINVCNMLYERGKIDIVVRDEMIAKISIDFWKKLHVENGDGIEEYDLEDLFICSFSKNGDSLPMWNYYLKNGDYQGYNLGFKSPYSNCSLNDEVLIDRVWPFEVCYSDEGLYEKIVDAAVELNETGIDNPEFSAKLNAICYYLVFTKLKHKAECFSHEEEIRLVLLAGEEEKKNIKYRIKNGILIPYLEIGFFHETLKEITIGPLMEREIAEKNLKTYIKQKGYRDITIKSSKTPIRY